MNSYMIYDVFGIWLILGETDVIEMRKCVILNFSFCNVIFNYSYFSLNFFKFSRFALLFLDKLKQPLPISIVFHLNMSSNAVRGSETLNNFRINKYF